MQSQRCTELALLAIAGVSPSDGRWVCLHVGDPGPSGTANAARNSTRKAVSFTVDNTSASSLIELVWAPSDVVAEERYTHASVWTSANGGDFLWSLSVAGSGVRPGDEFHIPAGQVVVEVV